MHLQLQVRRATALLTCICIYHLRPFSHYTDCSILHYIVPLTKHNLSIKTTISQNKKVVSQEGDYRNNLLGLHINKSNPHFCFYGLYLLYMYYLYVGKYIHIYM